MSDSSGIAAVEIFINSNGRSTDLGQATLSGSNWSYAINGLTPGTYTFYAVGYDKAGNMTAPIQAGPSQSVTEAPALTPATAVETVKPTPGTSTNVSGPNAVSVTQFSASLGVNTHFDETWSSYANVSTVISALHYIGVGFVRDSMAAPTDAVLFKSVAAAAGVKFDVYLSESMFGFDSQIAAMRSDTDILRAVEGINEGDAGTNLTYAGQTGFAAIAATQQALYAAFAPTGMTVIAPSYGRTGNFALAVNTAAWSTAGNIHEYSGTGNPPANAVATFLELAATVAGSQPVIATETGYYTGPSLSGSITAYQHSGVSELVQAKYLLTLAFDNWKAGIRSTDVYELLDRENDPNNINSEHHFGMFNADGTPKLAATALHNLTATLADTGTVRTNHLGYAISGAAPNANSLLLEKSYGTFELAVWNDIRLTDAITGADLVNPAVPVTIQFGQTMTSVREIDPLLGTGAVATWSNASAVSIDLPDHPVLLEVVPAPAATFTLSNFIVPETAASDATIDLWNTVLPDAVGATGAVTVSSVGTSGTHGAVVLNPAGGTLRYTAPTYSPLTPTDSFTVTLADAAGHNVTATVAVSETAPANALYDTVAGTRLNTPASGWTLVSLAAGQQLMAMIASQSGGCLNC